VIADKDQALRLLNVSRETCERLEIYEQLLQQWRNVKNLVGPGTLSHVWTRHFIDSIQLLSFAPDARRWVDFGTGAGFPGLVLAIALAGRPDAIVHLVESDNRKCAFLRRVIRATGACAKVEHARVEEVVPHLPGMDVVTARAVAPLDKLVEMAMPIVENGAIGLFPKGREHRAELTRLRLPTTFSVEAAPSLTDERAAIIVVRGPGSGKSHQ